MAENDATQEQPDGGGTPNEPADLAGYPDVPSLVEGYRNSSREAQRLRNQVQQAAAQPREQIPTLRQRPEDRLSEFGIPVDAMGEFVREQVGQLLAPLARGAEARTRLLGDYPDYLKFEVDVARHLQSDPELSETYNRMFQADPAGAMEYAFLKFGEDKRKTTRPATERSPEESAHAAIPSQRKGDARRGPDEAGRAVEEAFKQYQQTGTSRDAAAYARARLHTVIKDEFLNQ